MRPFLYPEPNETDSPEELRPAPSVMPLVPLFDCKCGYTCGFYEKVWFLFGVLLLRYPRRTTAIFPPRCGRPSMLVVGSVPNQKTAPCTVAQGSRSPAQARFGSEGQAFLRGQG